MMQCSFKNLPKIENILTATQCLLYHLDVSYLILLWNFLYYMGGSRLLGLSRRTHDLQTSGTVITYQSSFSAYHLTMILHSWGERDEIACISANRTMVLIICWLSWFLHFCTTTLIISKNGFHSGILHSQKNPHHHHIMSRHVKTS